MNKIDYKRFYSELGKLLYAVANVDKAITPEEKDALHKMVRTELVPAEKNTDEFGTDAAHYTEIEFEFLDEEIIDSETALQSFIDYIEDHQKLIDKPMRDTCLRLAEKLASAYKGTNKKEQELLETLKDKLKSLSKKKK